MQQTNHVIFCWSLEVGADPGLLFFSIFWMKLDCLGLGEGVYSTKQNSSLVLLSCLAITTNPNPTCHSLKKNLLHPTFKLKSGDILNINNGGCNLVTGIRNNYADNAILF